MNPNEKMPEKCLRFICESCDFKCSKKSNYKKHLSTSKHQILTNPNNLMPKNADIGFSCNNCKKIYKHASTLSNHKKVCIVTAQEINQTIIDASANEVKSLTNIVLELVKSNNEIQKQMLNMCEKIQPNTINSNNVNTTNNKIFNLQFFLNEECKDAMNMSEFINSIQLKISDLENIGKNGYVEGMSNIIIKHLNNTDVNKRPIHCSDAKRETLYIKEENKWEKDTLETKQMFKAVRGVDKKNCQLLTKWKETYPKCMDSKSHQSDDYMKVVSKVMDSDAENVNKVIKKVTKEVVIDK